MNKTYFYRISKNIFQVLSDYLDVSTLIELDWNAIECNGIHHGRKDWNFLVESLSIIKQYRLINEKYKTRTINGQMCDAAELGSKRLVDYFISKGANCWNGGMSCAAFGCHTSLVHFFISRGADDWNRGMQGASQGKHQEFVDFFISKGANRWILGIRFGGPW